jgi:hypothetical protein
MLYVRIKADFRPQISPRLFDIAEPDPDTGKMHPLAEHYCPACGDPLVEDGRILLVPVGIDHRDRENRENRGWTNAGCVAVHLACTGYTEAEVEQLHLEMLQS